jgi:hypothetical protein
VTRISESGRQIDEQNALEPINAINAINTSRHAWH